MNVQIIRQKGGFTLIEWEEDNRLYRSWVLPEMVVDGSVDRPQRGIPYGVDFSGLVVLQASSQVLDTELKRRNIWTYEDVLHRAQEVLSALQATYGVDLAYILQAAKLANDSATLVAKE